MVRVFVVDVALLKSYPADSPQRWAHQRLTDLDIPAGTPFLLDDDWTVGACARINEYLTAAAKQRAYSTRTLRNDIVGPLRRLLEFVRSRQGATVELSATTPDDLVAYRDWRRETITERSWANEASILSGFFRYAADRDWMTSDPFPRWGAKRRNTLVTHRRDARTPRCLALSP